MGGVGGFRRGGTTSWCDLWRRLLGFSAMVPAMTDELLQCVEIETGAEPTACVIWLHGLGADGHDFEPIVPELGLPADLPVRFVFPHAPTRPVTLNQGMVMRAWYDIDLEFNRDHDEQGMRDSARQVEALIAAEKARGFPSERMVLAGFSQGGAVAYHVALRHAEPLAGILVLSAYLLLADRLTDEASEANKTTPILQCHGTFDPVVPIALGEASAKAVRQVGYDLTWKTYPAPHGVHPDEVRDIGNWLTERLQ